MSPIVLKFLIVASYTGAVVPVLIALVVPLVRRAISRGVWRILLVFIGVHAVSFIPFLIAHRREAPSALEALWIPMPLGVFFFFLASFAVVVHWFHGRCMRRAEGGCAGGG